MRGYYYLDVSNIKFIINFIKNIQLSDSFTRFLVLNYLFSNELNNHDLKALSISEEDLKKELLVHIQIMTKHNF